MKITITPNLWEGGKLQGKRVTPAASDEKGARNRNRKNEQRRDYSTFAENSNGGLVNICETHFIDIYYED